MGSSAAESDPSLLRFYVISNTYILDLSVPCGQTELTSAGLAFWQCLQFVVEMDLDAKF